MNPVAYFSAEYAFDDLPIFAGGLGVLATDYLQAVQELDTPFVAVGLFYHYGFADITSEDKPKLNPANTGWDKAEIDGVPAIIKLNLSGQELNLGAWRKKFDNVTVYLLDADIEANSLEHRQLTAHLYDKNHRTKIMQDAILGIGGVEFLSKMGIEPSMYHLNEGHSALAIMALLADHRQKKPHATFTELCEGVAQEVVSSKHTVLSGAGLYISSADFHAVFDSYFAQHNIDANEMFQVATDPIRKDDFTTTRLLLTLSRKTNAVSKLHALSEKDQHPDSPFKLFAITNGVHIPRWQHPAVSSATNQATLWQGHQIARKELIDYLNNRLNSQLDPEMLTVVWARRITSYKRPLEMFEDVERLQQILTNRERPIQIVIAGKPNVEDLVGVEIARQLGEHAINPAYQGRIAYLKEYDLAVAKLLVAGADVWLNTPQKGYEASGTSGMKAGSNGVLQCSVSDGWVDEVKLDEIGWTLQDLNVADCLYGYLEYEIAPLFYERGDNNLPLKWLERMEATRSLIESEFCAGRMRDEYYQRLYKITP